MARTWSEETGVNADGPGAASGSAATAVVLPLPPSILVSPTISGNATQGQTLTESDGTWTGSPTTYGYQWSDCDRSGDNCRLIFGATHRTYTLIARDVGHTIRVQQSASNAGGSGTATSPASAVVQPTPGPPSNLANISPSVTGRLGPVAATRWNATLRTALSKALVVSKRATTIGQVIRHNGYVTTFSAPRGGLLLISWYFVPKRGQRAGGKQPVRMATARLRFVHRGVRKIKITLTPAGRRLLRGATRIAITAKDSFAPVAGPTIRATRTLRLRR